MYRIEFADIKDKVRDYLMTYNFMNNVGAYMKSFLTASAWDYKYYGNKSIKLKVNADSVSYKNIQKGIICINCLLVLLKTKWTL